jgi:hypothetical protein
MSYAINLRILQLLLDAPKPNRLSTAYFTLLILHFCKGLTLRVVARMISDEFDSFPANPESSLFIAGDLVGLCQVGRLFGRALAEAS